MCENKKKGVGIVRKSTRLVGKKHKCNRGIHKVGLRSNRSIDKHQTELDRKRRNAGMEISGDRVHNTRLLQANKKKPRSVGDQSNKKQKRALNKQLGRDSPFCNISPGENKNTSGLQADYDFLMKIQRLIHNYEKTINCVGEEKMFDTGFQRDAARGCIADIDNVIANWRQWRKTITHSPP